MNNKILLNNKIKLHTLQCIRKYSAPIKQLHFAMLYKQPVLLYAIYLDVSREFANLTIKSPFSFTTSV